METKPNASPDIVVVKERPTLKPGQDLLDD